LRRRFLSFPRENPAALFYLMGTPQVYLSKLFKKDFESFKKWELNKYIPATSPKLLKCLTPKLREIFQNLKKVR